MTQDKPTFSEDFKRRIREIKVTRWVRFGLVSLIFLLWVVWMGTPWLAVFELLLFDIYITGYIPFTWWKKSKNALVRTVMSWVDAIVYALVLVYFIFSFVGQNYQIPSSSLEKTLLIGDYLWVNKFIYGPRVPITPVHFPLVHNTFMGHDSYLAKPELKYKRLKGLRKVEEGDIVVFNFPAGDTVATKFEESPKYYDLLVKEYGREAIRSNPAMFGEVKYRPVDRRQNFVKRAVGLPGQTIRISNDTVYIDGKMQAFPENVQFNYIFATTRPLEESDIEELGINKTDIALYEPGNTSHSNLQAFLPKSKAANMIYIAPLTGKMIYKLQSKALMTDFTKLNKVTPFFADNYSDMIFPYGSNADWTHYNYGGKDGILIPAKGTTIPLNYDNWVRYQRCIRNYEGHTDAYYDPVKNKVFIDGKAADSYTFAMDYYWMMGDNRDNSQDSRFWGFVPEDHIIGTPMIVLISFDRDRSLFDGKIRFNRILHSANPDKK